MAKKRATWRLKNKLLTIFAFCVIFTVATIVLTSLGIFCPPFGAVGAALVGLASGLLLGILTVKLVNCLLRCLHKPPKEIPKESYAQKAIDGVKSGYQSTIGYLNSKLWGDKKNLEIAKQDKEINASQKTALSIRKANANGEYFGRDALDLFAELSLFYKGEGVSSFNDSDIAFIHDHLHTQLRQNISKVDRDNIAIQFQNLLDQAAQNPQFDKDEMFEKIAAICWVMVLREKIPSDKDHTAHQTSWAVSDYRGHCKSLPAFNEINRPESQHIFVTAQHSDFILMDPKELLASTGMNYAAAKAAYNDKKKIAQHDDKSSLHLDDDDAWRHTISNRSAYHG